MVFAITKGYCGLQFCACSGSYWGNGPQARRSLPMILPGRFPRRWSRPTPQTPVIPCRAFSNTAMMRSAQGGIYCWAASCSPTWRRARRTRPRRPFISSRPAPLSGPNGCPMSSGSGLRLRSSLNSMPSAFRWLTSVPSSSSPTTSMRPCAWVTASASSRTGKWCRWAAARPSC